MKPLAGIKSVQLAPMFSDNTDAVTSNEEPSMAKANGEPGVAFATSVRVPSVTNVPDSVPLNDQAQVTAAEALDSDMIIRMVVSEVITIVRPGILLFLHRHNPDA